jgi:hypothetical protein
VKSPVQTSITATARIIGLAIAALVGFVAVVACALFALAMTVVMLIPKVAFPRLRRERRAEPRPERAVTAAIAQ